MGKLGGPNTDFDYPGYDYAPQRTKIARQLALAQELQSQGSQPLQTDRMSGGWAVPISPFEGLSKLAQTYVGTRAGKTVEKEQVDLAKQSQGDYQKMLSTVLVKMKTDPGGAMADLATHPQGAQLMPIVMQEYQQQRQMALAKQLYPGLFPGGDTGAPQPQGAPPVGAGTVLAPGMDGAPPSGQPAQGGGQYPVGAQEILGGTMFGMPGITEIGKLRHSDSQTRGGVQYDQQGRAFIISNNGQPQYLPGIFARDKPELVNQGGVQQFRDPYSGNPVGQPIQQGLTPEQQQTVPLKQQETAIKAAEFTDKTGKPAPLPYGARPPTAAPVPTAPAAKPIPSAAPSKGSLQVSPEQRRALELVRPQQTYAANSSMSALDRSMAEIDRLLKQPGLEWVTGPLASHLPNLTGNQSNAQANIDTLKSQIGVETLTVMREASKSGGAVGNVTEKEWPILQNQLGALQQSQTTEEFKKNLGIVRNSLDRIKANIRQSYEMTYGKLPTVDATSGAEVKGVSGDSGKSGLTTETTGGARREAINKTTGEKLYSDDGGKTWHK